MLPIRARGEQKVLLAQRPHPAPLSLRTGRKIDLAPEIAGLIANNTRQIKGLGNRDHAPSGNVLREAGWPLRERAGRESLSTAPLSFHYRIDICTIISFFDVDNIVVIWHKVVDFDVTGHG